METLITFCHSLFTVSPPFPDNTLVVDSPTTDNILPVGWVTVHANNIVFFNSMTNKKVNRHKVYFPFFCAISLLPYVNRKDGSIFDSTGNKGCTVISNTTIEAKSNWI